jgi:uncharacterized protein
MPVYYFDTSALVKHYQAESGTSVVDAILGDPAKRAIVGRFGVTEVVSALAQRVRTGSLAANLLPMLLQRLRRDVAAKRPGAVRLLQAHFASAEKLIAALGPIQQVRTMDALHLAVALTIHQQGGIDGFVCSDHRLNLAAAAEGLTVIDPENPPAGFTV